MIHAARGDGQSEGERLEDARVVRVALRQPLHGHQVLQRFGRVVAVLDGARGVGDHVAESFAARGHEEQLFDHVVIAPGQIEIGMDDAALVELHGPRDRAAR